jgi:hypothetical protein
VENRRFRWVLGIHRRPEAIEQLQAALHSGYRNYIFAKIHPDLHPLHGMGRKYEYKYSTFVFFFADLIREGGLDSENLHGLSEDKIRSIRPHAGKSAA